MRFSGAMAQPSFHPVALKVFPALPKVIVRSHMSGRVAKKQNIIGKYITTSSDSIY